MASMQSNRPEKSIAILQSNYIPWKGYFDIVAAVDEFLIFDEVQYTRRDWRNRNKIVQGGKTHWLSIPVAAKGRYDAPVREIAIDDRNWARKHWASLRHAYGKSTCFAEVGPALEAAYEKAAELERLTDVNALFLRTLVELLDIEATFLSTDSIPRSTEDATERLIEICVARGATAYLSGPAAKAYIDKSRFDEAGVALFYADYGGYPEYEQGLPAFEHGVSMLDLLFRFGREARSHLKTVSQPSRFMVPA